MARKPMMPLTTCGRGLFTTQDMPRWEQDGRRTRDVWFGADPKTVPERSVSAFKSQVRQIARTVVGRACWAKVTGQRAVGEANEKRDGR